MKIFENHYIRDAIAYASVIGGFTVSNTNEYIRLFGTAQLLLIKEQVKIKLDTGVT